MEKIAFSFAVLHLAKASSTPLLILVIILLILLLLFLSILFTAKKNVKSMESAIKKAEDKIREYTTLTPIPCENYENMKINPMMKFHVKQYDVNEIGNLSIMTVNMGVMQMATFVLNSKQKNLPLISSDFMFILGNRKHYFEVYDLVENMDEPYQNLLQQLENLKQTHSNLVDVQPTAAWYDKLKTVGIYKAAKPENDAECEKILAEILEILLNHAQSLPVLSPEQQNTKAAITKEYTDGLISRGGVSTDVFKKSLGEEKTRDFFDTVFFGTTR